MIRLIRTVLLAGAIVLAAPALAHDGHEHAVHEVTSAAVPAITGFRVEKDATGGWNVFLAVENFTFTPEQVNGTHADNAGHAHLYINGSKLARLYGPALHIEALPFGPHDLKVVLFTNDHAEYQVKGRPIEAATSIDVQ